MVLKKKDFIEIEFTGKTKDGRIFDTNIKEDLKKTNLNVEAKPVVFCLGEGMFLEGIDKFLAGKEIGDYKIELSPEDSFGRREPKLIQMIPIKVFLTHKYNPAPGAIFQFDGRMGRVLNVSGGRVTVDFNNPLAGKQVEYKINVLRKVDALDEKVKSLISFFFRQDFKFKIEERKLLIEADKGFKQFIELFKDKFKEILDLDLEIIEADNKEKN